MDLEGHLLHLINESPFCDMCIYYMHFWNWKKNDITTCQRIELVKEKYSNYIKDQLFSHLTKHNYPNALKSERKYKMKMCNCQVNKDEKKGKK